MNEFTVRLDLAKGKARQQQTVFVRQGDKNATTIVATITDHGAAAATSGLTARFSMRLPDGTHYYRKAASLSGNVATVALDETQAASVAGRTDVAYFQLLQGSTVVASTESFTIVVLPDALADAEVAESYDSAIQDAIDALDDAVADMVEDVLEAHPEWTTSVQDGSISLKKLSSDISSTTGLYAGKILLESGTFADGTLSKAVNPTRFRCADPIYMRHMHSITAPDGYEMWVFETDENGIFIKENRWRKTFTKAMCSESTRYVLIVLRDPSAPNTDISSRLDDVQDAITFILESDTIATATQQMESATNEFDRPRGLAYADIGAKIIFTTSGLYRYVRVEKDDDIDAILFRIGGNRLGAYVRYVNDSDIVLSEDVTSSQVNLGIYKLNTEVLYKPSWPSESTALYLFSNGYTAAGEGTQFGVLELYRQVGNMEPDAFAASLASMRREIELARNVDYDSVCRSVCRLGMSFNTVPQQSTYAYIEAYKAGFRCMLCDLRFTSDGVPVLWHDEYLNQLYEVVYNNGSLVPKTPAVYIASTSYSDLLQYDFGVYRGNKFEGTKILTLDTMLDLCKKLGCDVYIEEKLNPTQEQFDTVFGLIDKYNMRKQVVWCPQSTRQLDTLTAYEPDVYICFMTNLQNNAQLSQSAVDKLVEKRNDFNKDRLSISVQKNAVLTGPVAESIAQNGIGLMGGTLESEEQVLAYYNRGYPYTMMTEVLSSGIVAGQVLFNTILS